MQKFLHQSIGLFEGNAAANRHVFFTLVLSALSCLLSILFDRAESFNAALQLAAIMVGDCSSTRTKGLSLFVSLVTYCYMEEVIWRLYH